MNLDVFLLSNPYFQPDEAEFLTKLINGLPINPLILEIGTFKGQSAILMAKARYDIRVITIDPHVGTEDGFKGSPEEVKKNIFNAMCLMKILHLPISSQEYEPEAEFDLLFIDGDHSLAAVEFDFKKFLPSVKDDGMILFHDVGHMPGVTDFVKTLNFKTAISFKSMLGIKKCDLC